MLSIFKSSPGYGSKPSQGLGLGSLGHLWTGEVRDSLDWTLAPLVLLAIEVFEVPGIFSTPLGLGLGSLGALNIHSSPGYGSKPPHGLALGSLGHRWTGEVGDSLDLTLAPLVLLAIKVFEVMGYCFHSPGALAGLLGC